MAQTAEGAIKSSAKKAGLSVAEYLAKQAAGLKRCIRCKGWRPVGEFGKDASRHDGLTAQCGKCRKKFHAETYVPSPGPEPGRRYVEARDGDKEQARGRVNHLVNVGVIPDPDDLPCKDCGDFKGERRHEYDHHLGYAAEHHEHVEAVCTLCHAKRDNINATKTHCIRGHEFTPENTIVTKKGRACRDCHAIHDKNRGRDAAYWRAYREKRKARKP